MARSVFGHSCHVVAMWGLLVVAWVLLLHQPALAENPYAIAWQREISTTVQASCKGIATDPLGNVYVVGATTGKLHPGYAGGRDMFVRRYDPAGRVVWTTLIGTSDDESGSDIMVSPTGGIFVVGNTTGTLVGGITDKFVCRLELNGKVQWTRQIGNPPREPGRRASFDGSGGLFLAGQTEDSLDGANVGGRDGFVSKYSETGETLWTRQFGSDKSELISGAAADASDSVIVVGSTTGSLTDENSDGRKAFAVKYDSDGALVWVRQFGSKRFVDPYGVATDEENNVYVVGCTGGPLDRAVDGLADAFVRKYDEDGVEQWTRQIGNETMDKALAVTVSASGYVYVCGATNMHLEMSGSSAPFLSKLDRDGRLLWTRIIKAPASSSGWNVAVDARENVYLVVLVWGQPRKDAGLLVKLASAASLNRREADEAVDE